MGIFSQVVSPANLPGLCSTYLVVQEVSKKVRQVGAGSRTSRRVSWCSFDLARSRFATCNENIHRNHGVIKTCRLSWLTNSTLVYEPKCGGRGVLRVSGNAYSCTHGAQINFGDLTLYLTYGRNLCAFENFY
jgi:hypothetical protein